jgi:ATP-dependent RNA helicase DeaD
MKDPNNQVGAKNSGSATVSHEFYLVNARDRYEALKRLADANPDIFSVVLSYQKGYTSSC